MDNATKQKKYKLSIVVSLEELGMDLAAVASPAVYYESVMLELSGACEPWDSP